MVCCRVKFTFYDLMGVALFSLSRPMQFLRASGGWGSHISRQSPNEGGKVVSPTHRPLLTPTPVIFLVLISVKARLQGSPRLINAVESTKVNRVRGCLNGSPRLIHAVESTKVNRVRGCLNGSPRSINAVESTKVNRVNSSFHRKWSTGLRGEQAGDGQLSFNVVDLLWVTHHRSLV
jgi:hypothetical protein